MAAKPELHVKSFGLAPGMDKDAKYPGNMVFRRYGKAACLIEYTVTHKKKKGKDEAPIPHVVNVKRIRICKNMPEAKRLLKAEDDPDMMVAEVWIEERLRG